jgi:hypothetical protein
MIHVGLDLDGVFADFQGRYEALYWPYHEPLWDVYDGYKKRYTSEEFKRQIKTMARNGHYATLDLYPGARECWQRIRALPNVKMHVLTYRPREAWADTALWLREHDLEADSLHFTSDKTILKAVAGPSAWDIVVIDDWDEHVKATQAAGIISFLCDRPWNQSHGTVGLARFAWFVENLSESWALAG